MSRAKLHILKGHVSSLALSAEFIPPTTAFAFASPFHRSSKTCTPASVRPVRKGTVKVPQALCSMDTAAAQNLAIRNLYAKVEKVGEGTYASVFLARNVKTGQRVAIKKIKIVSNENGMDVTAIREVKFLKELNHPNVIKVR